MPVKLEPFISGDHRVYQIQAEHIHYDPCLFRHDIFNPYLPYVYQMIQKLKLINFAALKRKTV
jgi:hypothetical protein